jgi:predicted negative regulator of RcsB-dependent stress response
MGIAMARNNLGEVASDLGDLDLAEQQFTAFLITSARAGNEQFEAHAYMNLAVVLVRRKQPLEALPLLDQAVARFERIAAHHFADQARVHRVEALLDADDQLGAQAALAELLDTPERRASLAPLMSEIEKLAARLSTDQ